MTEAASVLWPTPAKAWRVVPPIAVAAKPVEAVTYVLLLGKLFRSCFRMSDFPVPTGATLLVLASGRGMSSCEYGWIHVAMCYSQDETFQSVFKAKSADADFRSGHFLRDIS